MSRSAMDIFEPAFLCCERDMTEIFHSMCTDSDRGQVITSKSAFEFYRKINPNVSEEKITVGFNKLVHGLCGGSVTTDGIDLPTFMHAIEQFSTRVGAKGKGEDILMDIGRVCVEMAHNDPIVFQRMLNLPNVMKQSEVEELMKYLVS